MIYLILPGKYLFVRIRLIDVLVTKGTFRSFFLLPNLTRDNCDNKIRLDETINAWRFRVTCLHWRTQLQNLWGNVVSLISFHFSLVDVRQNLFLAHQTAAKVAAKNPIPATMPIEIALFLRYAGTSKLIRSLVASSSESDIAATSKVYWLSSSKVFTVIRKK